MSTNRNQPCPCGSGRKYKNCCLAADEARARSLRLVQGESASGADVITGRRVPAEALRQLDALDVWELDAVPVPPTEEELVGRSCVLLLVVGELLLDAHIDTEPPGEPSDVALWLAQWLAQSVTRLRVESGVDIPMPELLRVRHATVAAALSPLLPGTRVEASSRLRQLDRAARGLRADTELVEGDESEQGITLLSFPQTWSAWGVDNALLRVLFEAASRFYASQPWNRIADNEALTVHTSTAEGASWTACILGAGGEEFGLVLYERDADYTRVFTVDDPYALVSGLEGAMVSLYFDARPELPRAMQREFRAQGWPVAGPNAYPVLSCTNTPAGGVSRAQLALLTQSLDAIARLVGVPDLLPEGHAPLDTPVAWTDESTQLRLEYRGSRSPADVLLWSAPTTLAPGIASGAAANPHATFPREAQDEAEMESALEPEMARIERFATWLESGRGERMRARGGATTAQHVANAQLFVEHLAFGHAVTVAAVHEMHLRNFLYLWYPTHVASGARDASTVLASLRQFFAWLDTEGITCVWAAPILDDREALEARVRSAVASPDGQSTPSQVGDWWHVQFNDDLFRRVMLPDHLLSDSPDDASEWLGEKEATLLDELQALLLLWREAEIASGVTDPAAVRAACTARQRAWEAALHPLFGKTPAAIVRQERRRIQREEAADLRDDLDRRAALCRLYRTSGSGGRSAWSLIDTRGR